MGEASLQMPVSRHLRLSGPLSLWDGAQLKITSEPTCVVLDTYLTVP